MTYSCNRISVIVPLYNHALYIEEAIRSVIEQGPIVGEIIVIDDGSQDNSVSVMRDLARTDPRIRFTEQTNQGAHTTINRGLRASTCEFVTILNSDDAYEPERLIQLVGALDLDQGSNFAASSISFMDKNGSPILNPRHTMALKAFKTRHDLGLSLIDGNFLMTTSNFLMRRSLIDAIGVFAPLRYAHDLDFALRATAFGHRLAFIDRPLMRYRFHPSNTISEDHQKVRLEWAIVAAYFLHSVWEKQGSKDWDRVIEAYNILDRHQLTKAANLCLLYFNQHPSRNLEESGILNDIEFRDAAEGYI